MSLFRRRPAPVSTTARSALRDPVFACRTPGVLAVTVDYDPGTWVRTPGPGVDRTEWVRAHADAYASDLGLSTSDDAVRAARAALDVVADTGLSHTCDLVTLQAPGEETGAVAWVDVVDEELGLLEHGTPDDYTRMADLAAQGARPRGPEWFPTRRQPGAWQVSSLQGLDDALATTFLERAYRRLPASGARPDVHLYAAGIYSSPRSTGPLLRLFMQVDVQLAEPGA